MKLPFSESMKQLKKLRLNVRNKKFRKTQKRKESRKYSNKWTKNEKRVLISLIKDLTLLLWMKTFRSVKSFQGFKILNRLDNTWLLILISL